jgi:hypothetical protein
MPQGDPQRGYTHCRNGHEFTTINTYRYTGLDGYERRGCRTCKRITSQNAYQAMMAAARLRGRW